jgi:hypothetical protein
LQRVSVPAASRTQLLDDAVRSSSQVDLTKSPDEALVKAPSQQGQQQQQQQQHHSQKKAAMTRKDSQAEKVSAPHDKPCALPLEAPEVDEDDGPEPAQAKRSRPGSR